MKPTAYLIFLAMLGLAGPAAAMSGDCTMPDAPQVPEGASAEREQMEAAAMAVREFIGDAQAYQLCLQDTEADLGEDITETQRQQLVAAFNDAVDAMEAIAEAFNTQLGAYNAAQAEN